METQSSTETKIATGDYIMPAVLWTGYCLDTEGYDVFENIVYQDNRSDILLENNGKASISKRTKHINTGYYFVTYSIEKYELSLEWYPIADTLVYFMKKPTQGTTFKRLQDKLMGITGAQDRGPGNPKKDH